MKKGILLALITAVILVSLVLSGCGGGGISQALYDQVNAQLKDAQANLTKAQTDLTKAQADKSAVDAQLKTAQSQIVTLQGQVNTLQAQASLTGATPTETATKIVKNYHDTHVYSTYDLFICSDMASEVWNMLKAQGISAVIVVGSTTSLLTDILQCDHAWVLATVAPGQTLALETTGGYAVKRTENAYYYVGWTFNSPADLKSYNDMIKEYNIRIVFRNQLNSEANKALALNNSAANPTEADKYMTLYSKLIELRTAQETELNKLMAKIKALATQLY